MHQIPLPLVYVPLRWRQAEDFWHLVIGDETVAYLQPDSTTSSRQTLEQQAYVIWLSQDYWSREGRPRLLKGAVQP
jgi:hypothetical protein